MRDFCVKLRGADVKEIEIFMLLVTVWVLLLLFGALFVPDLIPTDAAIAVMVTNLPIISYILFVTACLTAISGIFIYLGRFLYFMGPWLILSAAFWASLSLILMMFQPFSMIFGVCAFFTTTCLHLYTLQQKIRVPQVNCRKLPEDRRKLGCF